jgi:hypothetical protein
MWKFAYLKYIVMKTLFLKAIGVVAMISFATLFTSCDLFEDADDIDFDATLEETITVTEESTGTNVAYAETILLDATSDPDIDEYKDKITGFTVKKISYQVTSYDGPSLCTFSGTLAFGDASLATSTVSATITNLNLQQAYTSAQVFDLTFNQADTDKIAALLKDDKAVKIYLNGTLSQTPVYCTIRVIVDVSVKADAL